MNEARIFNKLLLCLIGANELASMRRKQKRKEARELRERMEWVTARYQAEYQEDASKQP